MVTIADAPAAWRLVGGGDRFHRGVLAGLRLRCVGFDIEPEITARLLQAGYRIHETPVAYRPRTVAAGKKLAWVDGLDAIYTLCRCRFVR
jgi:hypothetical protein